MIYRFRDFVCSTEGRQLLHRQREVHLSPKAFDLLQALLAQHPKAVSREELRNILWAGVFVSNGNLPLLINEIRQALHDHASNSQFIRTVRRFGYAFACAVDAIPDPSGAVRNAAWSCWVVWATQSFPLKNGPNVVGRQPGVDVFLDATGVSRHHSRIIVDDGSATVEDLGSKNGTFVDGSLIASSVPLKDGSRLQLGHAALVFRVSSPTNRTETLIAP